MMAEPVVDQQARDMITGDLDSTLFVEAGAGTGKTQSLVDRIVRLLATGRVGATNMAAITFTEAAASELRNRVRDALEEATASEDTDPTERGRCKAALDDLDSAAVETIHAFCRRLLALHPLQAGLPPAFELLDGTEADGVFGDEWDAWFGELLERANRDSELATPLLRVLGLGATPSKLRDLASGLRGHWDRLGITLDAVPQPSCNTSTIADGLEAACAHAAECKDAEDAMARHLAMLRSMTRRLRLAGDDFAVLQALGPIARNRRGSSWGEFGRLGAATNWPKGELAGVRDQVAAAHQAAMELHDEISAAATAAMTTEISRFVLKAAEGRRRSGRLEFQDLLVLARDLLARSAEVREALRERYTHVLVDEFQDTDPLQAEIALLLGSAPADEANNDWLARPVDQGRLFFVGDPKQSIYRFRRADIDLYLRVRKRFQDSLVPLTQNFRSVPAIIEWVNALFASRLTGAGSERQAPYQALAPSRPPLDDASAVSWVGGSRTSKAGEIRTEEAETIVALLHRIREEGLLVRDGDASRPARLEDIAILSRARSGVRSIVDSLESAAVPHRVESRTLVFEAQEIRDLISILRAIDDPTDEVALLAALRSPAFACGDDDLVRYQASGGRWDFRRETDASLNDNPVVEALRWLRAQHERRWWVPLTRLVDDVMVDRRLFELALVDRRPRERWQRLRFVVEQARAHAERPDATLRSLIDWLQWQSEQGAQVQERVVPEPDDDAVRIMTIHASKGLEFPIVILVGLGSRPRSQSSNVLWSDKSQLEVSLGGVIRTTGYESAQETNGQLDELEEERLLYVAMTRSQDHLVLSLFHKERPENSKAQPSQAEEIARFAGEHQDLCAELVVERGRPDRHDATTVPTMEMESVGDREAWRASREALIESQRGRHTISATTLARELAAPKFEADPELDAGLEKDPPVEELPAWRRGRAGTAIGRAVHSALQTIDIATGDNLGAIAAAQAAAEGVADRTSEVERLVRTALDSDAVRRAVAADRYWREVYVAKDFDGLIVDGFIDLLYDTDDGYVVVDYKTDSVGAHNVDDVLARYRPQALAYALVLSEQLGRPVARCEFVFVSAPGGAVTRVVDITEDGLAELRAAMKEAVS